MPTEEQIHLWQNQNKKKISRLPPGPDLSKQVHCAQCDKYSTKKEIMAGEAEMYRQANGMWLCSCCQELIQEWFDANQ